MAIKKIYRDNVVTVRITDNDIEMMKKEGELPSIYIGSSRVDICYAPSKLISVFCPGCGVNLIGTEKEFKDHVCRVCGCHLKMKNGCLVVEGVQK